MELVTWVVATVLSFLGVFLQGAVLGFPLNASIGIVTLVTALAALALGGFNDLRAILASAIGIGVLLQGVRWHNTVHPTFVYAVLGAVILVAMVVRASGRRRSDRDGASTWTASLEPRPLPDRLRLRPLALVVGLVLLVVAVVVPTQVSIAHQFDLATLAAFAVVALSIAVLTGWAGQITLGQMGFAALGASLGAAAIVTWRLDVSLALLICLVAGALAGVVVGLPSLRASGLLPAAATLAFALAASGYLFDPNQFSWIPDGEVVPARALGVWNIASPLGAYELSLIVSVLCLVGLVGIRASALGRAIRAVRENDLSAQSYTVSPGRAKLTAYAISGGLASVAGCLLVVISQHFDAATYAPEESLTIFTASVVGGVGSLLGVLLGAFYLNGSRWLLTGYWQLLPTAVGVLVVLMVFPGGFSSLLYGWRDRIARRRAERLGVPLLGPATATPVDTIVTTPPAAAPADALLDARNVRVAFNGVEILFGVDLHVRRGEILALLGTNGAGKSTLLHALCGTAAMSTGEVRFDVHDLERRPAPEIAELGIAQMPGGKAVFESLTVEENLRIAGWLTRRDGKELRRRTEEQIRRFPVLSQRLGEPAANLSGGQQQMLGLAMVLQTRPSLLLIDELSLGLSPIAVEGLVEELGALRDDGTTIVVVEQSVDVALQLADRAYFLERGAVRFEGPTAELAEREDLLRSVYLSDASVAPEEVDATPARVSTPAAHRDPSAAGGPVARGDGRLRRPAHPRRGVPGGAPRRDPRGDRPERRGQDHALRRHQRCHARACRHRRPARVPGHVASRVEPGRRRAGSLVPGLTPLPRTDRGRDPRGGLRPVAAAARPVQRSAATPGTTARRTCRHAARRRAVGPPRPAATAVPARRRALDRPAALGRHRLRARPRPQGHPAGRTLLGRGATRGRGAGARHQGPARTARRFSRGGRARHGDRDRARRPHGRPRPRPGRDRGNARRGPPAPARGRVLPRSPSRRPPPHRNPNRHHPGSKQPMSDPTSSSCARRSLGPRSPVDAGHVGAVGARRGPAPGRGDHRHREGAIVDPGGGDATRRCWGRHDHRAQELGEEPGPARHLRGRQEGGHPRPVRLGRPLRPQDRPPQDPLRLLAAVHAGLGVARSRGRTRAERSTPTTAAQLRRASPAPRSPSSTTCRRPRTSSRPRPRWVFSTNRRCWPSRSSSRPRSSTTSTSSTGARSRS